MSLNQVLGGAGEAALAFGKVGGLAVADAAVVMADAMNVFQVSGDIAANTLSAAADASSTSIEGIAQAVHPRTHGEDTGNLRKKLLLCQPKALYVFELHWGGAKAQDIEALLSFCRVQHDGPAASKRLAGGFPESVPHSS